MASSVDRPSVGMVSRPWTTAAPSTTTSTASGARRRSASGRVIASVVTASSGCDPVTSATPGTSRGAQISAWLASVSATTSTRSTALARRCGIQLMDGR